MDDKGGQSSSDESLSNALLEHGVTYTDLLREFSSRHVAEQIIDSTSLQMSSSDVSLPTSQESHPEAVTISDPEPYESKPIIQEHMVVNQPSQQQRDLSQIPEGYLGTHYARGSQAVPEFENWPGKCEFNVDIPQVRLDPEGLPNKSVIFSLNRNQLYVKKDYPFKVNFFTSTVVPNGSKIRAMSMYIQQEFTTEIVKRCDIHTIDDYQMNVEAPDHLMRCECDQALYMSDPVSLRHSLVVPYKALPNAQNCCSYSYKFACNGGCYGGLNQRRFRVIFTLENGDAVIGRRSFEVKICSDPQKNCERDDKRAALLQEQAERKRDNLPSRKRLPENTHLLEVFDWINRVKSSSEPSSDDQSNTRSSSWHLEVPDRETYQLLTYARQAYRLMKTLEKYSPYIAQHLKAQQKKKRKK